MNNKVINVLNGMALLGSLFTAALIAKELWYSPYYKYGIILFCSGYVSAYAFNSIINQFKLEDRATANTPSAQKRRTLGMVAMTIVLAIILALLLIWR